MAPSSPNSIRRRTRHFLPETGPNSARPPRVLAMACTIQKHVQRPAARRLALPVSSARPRGRPRRRSRIPPEAGTREGTPGEGEMGADYAEFPSPREHLREPLQTMCLPLPRNRREVSRAHVCATDETTTDVLYPQHTVTRALLPSCLANVHLRRRTSPPAFASFVVFSVHHARVHSFAAPPTIVSTVLCRTLTLSFTARLAHVQPHRHAAPPLDTRAKISSPVAASTVFNP
jgi:hypothetical protein